MRLGRDAVACVVGLVLLVACGEGTQVPGGPTGPEEPASTSGVLASAPVARTMLGQTGPETVAFLAAPPGTVERGRVAALVVRRTGARVEAMMAAGGFDPVALMADVGDVVEVTLTDSAGQVTTTPVTVRRGTRPRVVRTAPGPQATDVPLNTVIRVVFTTPVRASEAAQAIRLFQGGVEVAGAVRVTDEADVVVDFAPTSPLAAGTGYELRVDAALRDVLGQALDTGVVVPFTTGVATSAPLLRRVNIPFYWRLVDGETFEVDAVGCAATCDVALTDVNWSSTSPAIATVTPLGPSRARISALAPGMTWIVASASGLEARMEVLVASSVASPIGTGANEIVFSSPDPGRSFWETGGLPASLFAIRDDGTGLTRLTSPATASYDEPSVARDGRIVFVVRHVDRSELAVRERDGSVRPLTPSGLPGQTWVMCPTWSPDARHVAYASSGDGTGTSIRVVRGDGTGEIVAEVPPHKSCPSWSPDGTQLSYGTLGGLTTTLNMADVSRFPEVSTRDVLARTRSALFGRWSPAGDAVASLVDEGEWMWLELTPLSGAPGTRVARMSVLDCCSIAGTSYVPEWSPDGRLILFSTGDSGVYLIDVNAGWLDLVNGTLPVAGDHATFVPSGVRFTQ